MILPVMNSAWTFLMGSTCAYRSGRERMPVQPMCLLQCLQALLFKCPRMLLRNLIRDVLHMCGGEYRHMRHRARATRSLRSTLRRCRRATWASRPPLVRGTLQAMGCCRAPCQLAAHAGCGKLWHGAVHRCRGDAQATPEADQSTGSRKRPAVACGGVTCHDHLRCLSLGRNTAVSGA